MRRLQLVLGIVAIALVFAGGAWYGHVRVSGGQEASSSSADSAVEPTPQPPGGVPSGEPTAVAPRASATPGATRRPSNAQKLAAAADARAKAAVVRARARPKALAVPAPFSFRISSFNILGSQHTVRGGQRASMAPGTVRAGWASGLINSIGLDVVGFSELQRDQYAVLMSRTGGFAAYPGTSLGGAGVPTTVMWRTSRFDLVQASTLQIDFLGQRRLMPIVLLKEKSSGRMLYVFNVHNSPVQDRNSHQGERNVQMAAEVAAIKRLRATGIPVFFLGDMNEHDEVFCKVTGSTDLTSPAGGSTGGGCRAPRPMRVDWIFGNGTWTSYDLNRDRSVRRVTDHTVLVADVTVK